MNPLARRAAMVGAVALPLAAIVRGLPQAASHAGRINELRRQRERDLSAPMPSMKVKEGYELSAREKVSKLGDQSPNLAKMSPADFAKHVARTGLYSGLTTPIGSMLGDVFVRQPLDIASKFLKKKLYLEPAYRRALESVVSGDDVVRKAVEDSPSAMMGVHDSLKRFAPSLAADPNAVRNVLRQAATTGGHLDVATLRMLAETEKFHREGKKRD